MLVIIIVTSIPSYARLARTSTLALKSAEFIAAERSLGATPWRIMLRHVMPNIAGPLLILGAMDVPVVVTVEAGLSFLGLGVLPPTASWGTHPERGLSGHPRHALAGDRRRRAAGADDAGLHLPRRVPARRARSAAAGQPVSNLLEVRGLSVDFMTARGPVHALRDVDLDVPRGRILGIVGESGSGKSTVIWAITRLLAPNAVVRGGRVVLSPGSDVLASRSVSSTGSAARTSRSCSRTR